MKIMIDTNVILDFFLSREPHASAAKQLFEMVCQEKIEAFTTASSVTDIYYIIAKRLGDATARKAIQQLLNIIGVIAVDGDDCTNALNLPIPDFEDTLIIVCVNKQTIDCIISNDKAFLQVKPEFANVVDTQKFLEQSS